mmetsp:Transcript_108410/g.192013  ORF Transcript_108410/g.192013 Transcript_108410/m.192013 type:complete len:319 (-) Transcript_108410:54-1010(-)
MTGLLLAMRAVAHGAGEPSSGNVARCLHRTRAYGTGLAAQGSARWGAKQLSAGWKRHCRSFSTPAAGGLWSRFVQWSYSKIGDFVYPAKADICNCGIDLGIVIPKPELVLREDIEKGSTEWRMHMYGAALYWHLATTPNENLKEVDLDMLRGKDVLEVACMQGGGARYLAEVTGAATFVATDNVQEHLDKCQRLHSPWPGLRFEFADALALPETYPPESFDVILCVQAVSKFEDIAGFIEGAAQLLRPGGRLIVADALIRDKFKIILDSVEATQLSMDACVDLSRAVHAVGLCKIQKGISYVRIVARKAEAADVKATS